MRVKYVSPKVVLKRYREIFLMWSESEPWPCHFCSQEVWHGELEVHHVDGNHRNNYPDNLVATHKPCHTRHTAPHRKTRYSAERNAKISKAKKGQLASAEAKANMSKAHVGKTLSAEHKGSISRGMKRRARDRDR